MPASSLALAGDYSPAVIAHRAIPQTLALAAATTGCDVHPFCLGILSQPERAALRGAAPPLVCAFVHAAAFPL
jgi:hypothetical protein